MPVLVRHPLLRALASLAIAFALAPPATLHAEPLGKVIVEAGEVARSNAPVSVVLPADVDPWRPMRLLEVKGEEKVPVPIQADPVERGRLWFILAGDTAAGASRTFELERAFPVIVPGPRATMDERTLTLELGGQAVFRYNHAHVVPPEGVDPLFIRSGYIFPLMSPAGKLITEDFPHDHLHHKGIWMPWTHTEFEGREIDFWNLGGGKGTVEFAGFESVTSGPVFAGFVAKHDHVDLTQPGGKVALHERWDVRLWNVGGPSAPEAGGQWLFDLNSTQRCASESPLKLLEYRYGGLGFRGAKEWNGATYKALSSEGKTHVNGHTTRAKWCDHSGAIEDRWSGVTIMDHPGNFRFPQSMRLWPVNGAFFCYAPVQLGDHVIEPGTDFVSRYRFHVHEGEVDAAREEAIWQDWAAPAAARFEGLGG